MGLAAAMQSTLPGRMEYELAAIAQFVFAAGGARGEGYRGIVGGGTNAWFGHYGRQSDALVEGDLVLMDYAADYAYYTSDIGRMWPVDGRFTDVQRTLYGFIVDYHRELLDRIRPGVITDEVMDEVAEVMTVRIDETAWESSAHEAAARGALSFRGHFSHPVGMAVHDVGDYRKVPLVEGAVFSVDPMIWIPDEHRYIRCEDTVVVTSDGYENLTGGAPLDCDEIESAMANPGVLDLWDPMTARAR
jgi:Xaa-Pro aminopeptidase